MKYLFVFINDIDNLNDINYYMPLSLLSISFIKENSNPSFYYLLRNINIFELFYVVYFAISFRKMIGVDFFKSLRLVSLIYGSGLIMWGLLYALLMLNLG